MAHDPIETWKSMKIRVWDESYYLINIDFSQASVAANIASESVGAFASVTRSQFGFSVLVDEDTWARFGCSEIERTKQGPLKVISTDSDLPFDVPGFIKAALEPINARKLKAAPICGIESDHFFTGADQLDEVLELFCTFSAGR